MEHELQVLGKEPERLMVAAHGCFEPFLGPSPFVVDLDVVEEDLHSHLEAADIELELSGSAVTMGDALLRSSSVKTFVEFAAVVAVGTSEPVAVAAVHTEVAAAVSTAAVAAAVEEAVAVAVPLCIVVAGDRAAAVGLHMVVVGCQVVQHDHQPYGASSGLSYNWSDKEPHLEVSTCLLAGELN